MGLKVSAATVVAWAFGMPASMIAQTSTIETAVTFELPVNLTQLSPDLERVRFSCLITSEAQVTPTSPTPGDVETAPSDQVLVVQGQVVATMRVMFPIPSGWLRDPVGKSATYGCVLMGFSKSLQQWGVLAYNSSTPPQFRINAGRDGMWQGTFTW